MSRRALLIGWAAGVVMTVAISVFLYGIAEEGLRVAIRATARLSTFAIACAFAGIRTREALIALPMSHAVHYAIIGVLAATTNAANAGLDMIALHAGPLQFGVKTGSAR